MQLQPLRYEYKPDNALGINSSGEHIGFSAQMVERVVPEAVTRGPTRTNQNVEKTVLLDECERENLQAKGAIRCTEPSL